MWLLAVLINIIIAVLLDEFLTQMARSRSQIRQEEALEEVESHPFDPLMAVISYILKLPTSSFPSLQPPISHPARVLLRSLLQGIRALPLLRQGRHTHTRRMPAQTNAGYILTALVSRLRHRGSCYLNTSPSATCWSPSTSSLFALTRSLSLPCRAPEYAQSVERWASGSAVNSSRMRCEWQHLEVATGIDVAAGWKWGLRD